MRQLLFGLAIVVVASPAFALDEAKTIAAAVYVNDYCSDPGTLSDSAKRYVQAYLNDELPGHVAAEVAFRIKDIRRVAHSGTCNAMRYRAEMR